MHPEVQWSYPVHANVLVDLDIGRCKATREDRSESLGAVLIAGCEVEPDEIACISFDDHSLCSIGLEDDPVEGRCELGFQIKILVCRRLKNPRHAIAIGPQIVSTASRNHQRKIRVARIDACHLYRGIVVWVDIRPQWSLEVVRIKVVRDKRRRPSHRLLQCDRQQQHQRDEPNAAHRLPEHGHAHPPFSVYI
jgi:hypothetical protein